MKYVVWALLILLAVVHQDVWLWDDTTLVFGFLPVSLVFHVGISVAASMTWWLATVSCWPEPETDDAGAEPTTAEGAARRPGPGLEGGEPA